jgi:hypothetical protein
MTILINRTFSETTPESDGDGEFSDGGMLAENEPCTFRELVAYMWDHPGASQSNGIVHALWFHSYFEVVDYITGTERETCVHYSRDNPQHKFKYWIKAARAAKQLRERI